ncbi:MAG: helix-turn-helix domain-containing protein [Firmicutes bacterium]|nr:helix-turn-helix domain-containing protein [Bacillota bacterium]
MHNFPKVLKELREEKNLTQADLAKHLGYKNETTISNWEIGKRTPELNNLIAIAKFFDVSLDYLVGMEK